MYDLIIIGGGPAGLTAALYAGRSRLKTLLLEKMALGGQIMNSERIENFPGFPGGIATHELIGRMHEQVKELGVSIALEEVVALDCTLKSAKTESNSYSGKAVLIATGARARKLGVPGEGRLTGRGVSYCATCDGPLYKDKEVVVVGGGNAVAEEALYLTRFAKRVTILHRRHELRALAILQEKLQSNKKIHFILGNIVTEITGSQKLESIAIKDAGSGKVQAIRCDGVFIYIGYEPNTDLVKKTLECDESGFILAENNLSTSIEGVFACGDCRKKSLYQVVTACGDGAVAADSAYKYLATKEK